MHMARRFRAGRTLSRLHELMRLHLFQRKSNECFDGQAKPGLFATLYEEDDVFIVGVFIRRRVSTVIYASIALFVLHETHCFRRRDVFLI